MAFAGSETSEKNQFNCIVDSGLFNDLIYCTLNESKELEKKAGGPHD